MAGREMYSICPSHTALIFNISHYRLKKCRFYFPISVHKQFGAGCFDAAFIYVYTIYSMFVDNFGRFGNENKANN